MLAFFNHSVISLLLMVITNGCESAKTGGHIIFMILEIVYCYSQVYVINKKNDKIQHIITCTIITIGPSIELKYIHNQIPVILIIQRVDE